MSAIQQLILGGNKAPVTFVASAAGTSTGSTTLVVNKPTGTVDTDLMIAGMASDNSKDASWTGDTGWTELQDQGVKPNLRTARKTASSEGASYTFVFDGGSPSSIDLAGFVLTFRSAAYSAIGSVGTSTSGGNITAGAVTAAIGDLLVAIFAIDEPSVTFPTPSGMTPLISKSAASSPSYAVFTEAIAAAGSTGTRASNPSGSVGNGAGVLVLLTRI